MGWISYNPNPVKADAGDCAVRAIAKALDISWEKAYTKLSMAGYLMCDMPNADWVWGSVLRKEGFSREILPNTCPDCYTVADFCHDNPRGVFVVKSENHVATVVNGTLFDSWNSEQKVPIYYWRKEGEH
jgi:hypothetical protein